jgi:hypothetical protein
MTDARDPREEASRELARLLATPEGLRLARLLQATGILAAPRELDSEVQPAIASPEPSPRAPGPPSPISIWQPRQQPAGTVWVRLEPGPLGDHYAAVRTLTPRRSPLPLRICLLGESVAAGYLYAPHLTPARVLADHLRSIAGSDVYEVIDLARTNETLGSLAATAEAAMQLEPDLLILFTGNNWGLLETPEISPYAPAVAARQRYAAALREGGLLGPARLARERLAEIAAGALERVARAAGDRTRVLLLVPEVNLADWETLQPVPWLPGDGAARWHALYAAAQAHLAAGDFAAAESVAWQMVELDGGACPTPFRLLARGLAARDNLAEARDAAVSEVDSVHYPLLAFLGAPQATTPARRTQELAAARHGFSAVDLRAVFAEHTRSPLPGRRLFLDYCHLTVEGIHVAMAAAAAETLRLLPPPNRGLAPDWRDLARDLPLPVVPPEADAVAKLGAAVHTAHRLLATSPKGPLLQHWLREALAASPSAAATLLDLAATRAAAPLPAVATAAQKRQLASPCPLLLQHGWRWDHLDAEVIEAIASVLDPPGRGEVERRLLAAHSAADRAELSRAPYLWEPLARFYPEAMAVRDLSGRAAFRTPWPESSFCLLASGEEDLTFDLTLRLPPIPGIEPGRTGQVLLDLGGRPAGTLAVTGRWSRASLRVRRDHLRPGLNRLTLRWPPPPPDGDRALEAAIRRLEEGIEADLHPVFGEVFSLKVRPA